MALNRELREDLSDRRTVAVYLADMTAQLAAIAHENQFDALGFILDMAHLEASNNSLSADAQPRNP
jgi:hypothetical protein